MEKHLFLIRAIAFITRVWIQYRFPDLDSWLTNIIAQILIHLMFTAAKNISTKDQKNTAKKTIFRCIRELIINMINELITLLF